MLLKKLFSCWPWPLSWLPRPLDPATRVRSRPLLLRESFPVISKPLTLPCIKLRLKTLSSRLLPVLLVTLKNVPPTPLACCVPTSSPRAPCRRRSRTKPFAARLCFLARGPVGGGVHNESRVRGGNLVRHGRGRAHRSLSDDARPIYSLFPILFHRVCQCPPPRGVCCSCET